MLLDPGWDVNLTKSKSFCRTLDYICHNLPHDSLLETNDGAPIPCTVRREKKHKQLVLKIVRILSTSEVEKYVAEFFDRFSSNIPELDDDSYYE